jgi:hypothetical protein
MRSFRVLGIVTLAGLLAAGAAPARAAEGDDAKALEVLLAKEAIRQQIYNYCRGLDRMDKALALQVWHPDGTAQYGGGITKGSEFVERAFKLHEGFLSHTHHMVDAVIHVTGDTAVSETTANSSMMQAIDEKAVQGVTNRAKGVSVSLIRGRYADKWSKRNGRWALDHRRYIEDFRTVQEFPAQPRPGAGRRDRTDPSYEVFGAQESFASASTGSKALEELAAKEEIRQQIYNYGRGIDRMDKALVLQVWHPDGTANYGGAPTTGAQFIEGLFKSLPTAYLSHTHQMVDSIIRVDGDKAISETTANTSMMQALDEKAVQGVLVRPKGVSVTLIRGRYADRWSKRNGRWALDHRRYIEDFRTVEEFPTPARPSAGKRDKTDPSYEIYPF